MPIMTSGSAPLARLTERPRRTTLLTMLVVVVAAACSAAPSASSTPTATPTPTPIPSVAATPPASASADPLAAAALFVGTYTGTWTNTTYGSTGAVTFTVELDRATSTLTIGTTLGGNVFGEPAPGPETVDVVLDGSVEIAYTSAIFGDVTVTADLSGGVPKIILSAPDVPSARIATFTAEGTFVGTTSMDFTYTVTFRDGTPPANGIASVTRS